MTPLVLMWHQHRSTEVRTRPCVLAGLGGFRELAENLSGWGMSGGYGVASYTAIVTLA